MTVIARLRPALAVLATLLLAACGSTTKQTYQERPAGDLFSQGQTALHAQDYQKATDLFNEVDRQHPYSDLATRAELLAAFAEYRNGKYDDAVVALDRYIDLHPGDRDIDYAYYLKALCYYDQISDVQRDQKMTQDALAALNEVVKRFPSTEYARDARLKIDLATDHLAGKDMSIGRYYEGQGLYSAAIGRFRTVVEKYQTTAQVPEALERLTECYEALGLKDEARKTAAVLGYNYPGSHWYAAAYKLVTTNTQEHPPTLLEQVWNAVF